MKKKDLNIMGVGNSLPRYVSPTAKVMNVNVQGVLCDSDDVFNTHGLQDLGSDDIIDLNDDWA